MKTNKRVSGLLMLFIVAIIWGGAFIAQSDAMKYIGPFTFNFIRNFIATIALFVFIVIKSWVNKNNIENKKIENNSKKLWMGGILTGVALFAAMTLQQFGIKYTTTSKAGFISSLYIVFVPVLGLILKKKVHLNVWISVIIAITGFYFLCIDGGFNLEFGDALVFLSTVFFAIQILTIDSFTRSVDGVKMSCIQFLVVSILSLIPMIFEKPNLDSILNASWCLLYAGVLSSCIGYTLQIIAQKNISPTTSSLILSLESVFCLIFSMIIFEEMLSSKEWVGGIMIFIAVILSQVSFDFFKKNNKSEIKS